MQTIENPQTATHFYEQAEISYACGKFDEAIVACQSALEIRPDFAEAFNLLGKTLQVSGKAEEAEHWYAKAIEIQPDFAEAIANLGALYAFGGYWQQAITCYQKAIALQPKLVGVYRSLAQAFRQLGKLEEAIESEYAAFVLEPDSIAAEEVIALGSTLFQQGKPERAAICYQRVGVPLENSGEPHPFAPETTSEPNEAELSPNSCEHYRNLGDTFHTQGSLSEAIVAYHKALELNPDEATVHYSLWAIACQQSQWEDAVAWYRQLQHRFPNSAWANHYLAAALTQLQQWEEVVIYSQRAIELSPNVFWSQLTLANALASLHNWEGALTAYYKALEIQPASADACLELGLLLANRGLAEQVLACLRQAIGQAPSSVGTYHKFGLMLAQSGLLNEAVACFQAAQQQPSTEKIYEKIWKGLNQLGPLDETNPFYQAEINLVAAEEYFKQTSQYTVIHLKHLSDADRVIIEKVGLSLAALDLMGQDGSLLEQIYINSFGEEPIQLTCKFSKKHYGDLPNRYGWDGNFGREHAFQQTIVETGYIYSICPVSGRILRSNQSFYIDAWIPMFVYRFESSEIFYLKCGHVHGAKMSLYFPRWELIIVLPTTYRSWGSYWEEEDNFINRLKGYLVSYWKPVKAYLLNRDRKKVAAVLGTVQNLGHDIWNFLTGIHYLNENQLLSKIDTFLVGPHEHIHVGDVFPEIPLEKIVKFNSDTWSLFTYLVDNNCVAVLVTDFQIRDKLASKIYSGAIRRCSQDFLEKIEIAKQHFPLVWIETRLHKRVWLSQVEGIANIIKALHSDFPQMGVVFAGWSRIENDYSYADAAIASEKATEAEILALLPLDLPAYSTIGNPIFESIVWTHAADLHVSPMGSGMALTLWIANKPGVFYSNKYLTTNHLALSLQLGGRENVLPSLYLPSKFIVDHHEVAPTSTLAIDAAFNCDWKAIYNQVIKIMKKLTNGR